MTDETPRRSVFGPVDQEAMISRIEESPDDDTETGFFDMEKTASSDALDSGIRVFSGDATPPPAGVPHDARVLVAGDIAADPAARRAFILHGPSGVRRPVG